MDHRFYTFIAVKVTATIATALLAGLFCAAITWASSWEGAVTVPRGVIVNALRQQQALGYRIDAIANSVRLQSGVMLAIDDTMRAGNSPSRSYRIHHIDYYEAFLEVAGLTPATAPSFVKASHAAQEDYLVDARLEWVIDRDKTKDPPKRALNVKAGWPPTPGAPTRYSYEDHSTDPAIKTTRQQVTSWRILDYGNAIIYAEIKGVSGRAISGFLGLIFNLIGNARAMETRFAIASDGTQVSLTTAKKLITLTQTITIEPEGRVRTGLPDNRPDLAEVEDMLENLSLPSAFLPMDLSPVPPAGR